MSVCNRSHYGAYCKAVKVVVDKDEDAEDYCCNLSTNLCLDVFLCPFTESCRTTCLIHHGNESAKNNKENQDAHIVAVGKGLDYAVLKNVCNSSCKREPREKKSADDDANKEGRINFLCDQCQSNGNDRRNK